jgi:hypothetical protein
MARALLSPLPAHSPASWTSGSDETCGVTTSVSLVVKDRCSSHIPNGSVSRMDSGPSG